MKQEEENYEEGYQENQTPRQFVSEIETYTVENPEKVQQIVNESEWGKKRNQKIPYRQQSIFEALGLE